MTREEAIATLEESKRQNKIMIDNPTTFWASHQMADGVKNAKRRIEALDYALTALRPVRREQVEKVWRGEWEDMREAYNDVPKRRCSRCKSVFIGLDTPFCEVCGAPMTDEAVDMVMERIHISECVECGWTGPMKNIELQQLEQKAQACREKRDAQLSTIYGVLDTMPRKERRAMLAQIIRHYEGGKQDE